MILLMKCINFTFPSNSSLHHQISFRFPSNFHFLLFSFQFLRFPFGRKFPSKWKHCRLLTNSLFLFSMCPLIAIATCQYFLRLLFLEDIVMYWFFFPLGHPCFYHFPFHCFSTLLFYYFTSPGSFYQFILTFVNYYYYYHYH